MWKPLIVFSFLLSITTFSIETSVSTPPKLNHEILFHQNELREAEDQINFFQLALDRSKAQLELLTFQVDSKSRLVQAGAATDLDLKTAEKNLDVLNCTIEIETLKIEQQLLNIAIKKNDLLSKEGRAVSLKATAQLFADQWKVRLNLGTSLVKLAEIELNFANYNLKKVNLLISKNVSPLEDLYDAKKDKKKAEESVTIFTNRLLSLERNYLEAQEIADGLTK